MIFSRLKIFKKFSCIERISFIYENNYSWYMKRVNIMIHGSVQGVFFRAKAKRIAEGLGLKGYAKNMPEGTVEIVAEGPEDKLKELISFCKKGPEAAEVSKVDVEFSEASNEFKGFEVRYTHGQ